MFTKKTVKARLPMQFTKSHDSHAFLSVGFDMHGAVFKQKLVSQ